MPIPPRTRYILIAASVALLAGSIFLQRGKISKLNEEIHENVRELKREKAITEATNSLRVEAEVQGLSRERNDDENKDPLNNKQSDSISPQASKLATDTIVKNSNAVEATKTEASKADSNDSSNENEDEKQPDSAVDKSKDPPQSEQNSDKPKEKLLVENLNTFKEIKVKPLEAKLDLEKFKGDQHDKWIVLTTIALPTDDVIFLASLEGWRVVVVGDTKTPENWSHPGVDYLDISAQESFGFATAEVTPYKAYTRKNIGYLYAIAHGATVIYETDDDNRPTDKLSTFCKDKTCAALMFAGCKLFNPYKHFGQPTLWPRGYPLGHVGDPQSTEYRLFRRPASPMIQQGLVNGDPDMDAIFRLTRKYSPTPLEVKFDPHAPAATLPPGVFSPFNSQNTLFHRDAFWALMLPSTTTFRICDIWRGYWAQRLLWEVGGHLGFFAPNAHQVRNSHSYMADAADEENMYFNTERLISFLRSWTCPADLKFFDCVLKLSKDMAIHRFWGEGDAESTKRWLDDLTKLGYIPPKRVNVKAKIALISKENLSIFKEKGYTPTNLDYLKAAALANGSYVNFLPVKQVQPTVEPVEPEKRSKLKLISQVHTLCCNMTVKYNLTNTNQIVESDEKFFHINRTYMKQHKIKYHATTRTDNFFKNINLIPDDLFKNGFTKKFARTLLIIVCNDVRFVSHSVPFLEIMHREIFPNILYCADDRNGTNFLNQTLNKYFNNQTISSRISLLHAPIMGSTGTGGGLGSICFTHAVSMGYGDLEGYMVVNDDTFLLTWNFLDLDLRKVWRHTAEDKEVNFKVKPEKHIWPWWRIIRGKYPRVVKDLRNAKAHPQLQEIVSKANFTDTVHGVSDTYYIPADLAHIVSDLFEVFEKEEVFLEVTIPMTLRWVVGKDNIVNIHGENLWKWMRAWLWPQFYEKLKWSHFFHPMKFSQTRHLKYFCEMYVRELVVAMSRDP